MESRPRLNTLAFQVDLWSARGNTPGNLSQVETRRKDIVYSSRTRAGTDSFKYAQRIRNTVADLLDKLPEDLKDSSEAKMLSAVADRKSYNIVHLIIAHGTREPLKGLRFFSRQHGGALAGGLQRHSTYIASSQSP